MALLATLSITTLAAQANPDSVRLRNDCRLAAQVIRTGQPAPKLEWAWELVGACPEAGPAAAVALRRLRAATDTAQFKPIVAIGFNVRDGALFRAALDVAGDQRASAVARAESLILLIYQLSDSLDVTYTALAKAESASVCPLGWDEDRGRPMVGTPLPADARAQAGAAVSAITRDSAAPAVVRIAADCVREARHEWPR